nr:hypothetical protein StreXyl84_45190 [Streptomyces sp. Xyl84]
MPTVAAATAAVERAFFGVAMRRMKETDTENLLRRGRGAADSRSPRERGRSCLVPRPRGDRRLLATSSREAAGKSVRKHPFY